MNVHQKSTLTLSGRLAIYSIGLIILALGITLNTKTGLGVSPIISIPYNISQIWHLNLGTMTFIFYTILVMIQILLLRKDFKIYQLLQIVMSLVTSFFIDIFDRMIPAVTPAFGRILILFLAIILTGIGAALTVRHGNHPQSRRRPGQRYRAKTKQRLWIRKKYFRFFMSCPIGHHQPVLCGAHHRNRYRDHTVHDFYRTRGGIFRSMDQKVFPF